MQLLTRVYQIWRNVIFQFTFRFTMLRQLLLIIITISGVLAVPLFIVQDADECQFKMQESSVLSTGTYIFQQIQSLQFDFIITANGNCPDLPLVYLRNETSISMAGSMERYGDMIRLLGEIQAPGKHLILVVPSTEGCDFEMQQQSSLGLQLPNCRVGDQFPIDFQPATQNEADWMNDFVDLMDDQEIPESVSDLLLVDGIRNYVAYDYETQWENLSKDAKNGPRHSAYRQIRAAYLRIKDYITGDLSQQNEAEATAKAACAQLNSYIDNPKQHVDFKTVTISTFNKWKPFNRMILDENQSFLDPFPSDVDQPTTQNEADLMQDFVELFADPRDVKEIPKSVTGLLLVDGIRNYVRYDYQTQWESLSKDAQARHVAAYRQIRQVYLHIKQFIKGDLSQQKEAEAAAQRACAYLNHSINNPRRHVDFKTVKVSIFYKQWKIVSSGRRIYESKRHKSRQRFKRL